MIRAAILDGDIISNVIVLDYLEQYPGAVLCPDWLGIGDNINTPPPPVTPGPIVGAQTL